MTRYLIGVRPGGNIAMAFTGEDDEILPGMLRLIKQAPSVCWHVTSDSPFGHGR